MKGVYSGGVYQERSSVPLVVAEVTHYRWPPRGIRRAQPIAERGLDTRRRRKAHQRVLRVAARYGLRARRS